MMNSFKFNIHKNNMFIYITYKSLFDCEIVKMKKIILEALKVKI